MSLIGWDPVTGLGSVNFTAFLDTVLSVQTYSDSSSSDSLSKGAIAGISIVIIIVAVALIVGGYFLYRKFVAKDDLNKSLIGVIK